MKLPDFKYARPSSLDEAIRILAHSDGEAKLIAGGQSLMPLLALRLAAPRLLVDLAGVDNLDRIEETAQYTQLGARVRWRDIERSAVLSVSQPLLVEAVRHVAHYQIRNRGTVGGSLAHADPAAELPAVAVTCGATIVTNGPSGERLVSALDFFQGPLTTVLRSDEIIVALRLPKWPPARLWGFKEFALRRGDFALAGAALHYDETGGCMKNVHIGAFGIGNTPIRLVQAEAALEGRAPSAEFFEAACAEAGREVSPLEDRQADARYRRALLVTLLRRALDGSRKELPA